MRVSIIIVSMVRVTEVKRIVGACCIALSAFLGMVVADMVRDKKTILFGETQSNIFHDEGN